MPDHALTMELGGTTYTIYEYFGGKELNEIIAKRVESDAAGNHSDLLPLFR